MPDFLPPAQRVLFMRIQQKQQEEEERARRMAEGGAERSRDTEGTRRKTCLCKTGYYSVRVCVSRVSTIDYTENEQHGSPFYHYTVFKPKEPVIGAARV